MPSLRARAHVPFARRVVLRIILNHIALAFRRARPFQKRRALRQDGLERIDLLLADPPRAVAHRRELDAGERARVRAQVPARDQVAARGAVEDLRGGWQRQVQVRWHVQVQVEVLLERGRVVGRGVLRFVGEQLVVVGGGGRDHQEGQRLAGARGREGRLLAVLQVVGVDAAHAEEQVGVMVAGHGEGWVQMLDTEPVKRNTMAFDCDGKSITRV